MTSCTLSHRAVATALGVLGALGCDERERPWAARPDGGLVDESRPFLPSSAEDGWLRDAGLDELADDAGVDGGDESPAPAPSAQKPATPVGGLWASCYRGFVTTAGPRRDVTRLGLTCGPINGMKQLGKTVAGDIGPDAPAEHRIDASGATCFRVFVAANGTDNVAVRVTSPNGDVLAKADDGGAFAVVDPERPFCTIDPTEMIVTVSTRGQAGRYALQVWQLSPSKVR